MARKPQVLGDDHPSTLVSATNLAEDLRLLYDFRAACDLDQDTLNRHRRVLGDDHPNTQFSFAKLAEDLQALGDALGS